MFKAKNRKTGEVVVVLEAVVDSVFGVTNFLIWENGNWRWRNAESFVPPNVEIGDNK